MPRRTARIHDTTLRYRYPQVDIDQTTRSTVHEPVGETPVVQYLGPGKTTISIQGHCYLDEMQGLKEIKENERVNIRTAEFNGTAMLEDASFESEGVAGGVPPHSNNYPTGPSGDNNDWRYTYDMEFTVVREN